MRLKIAVAGCAGRMGSRICQLVAEDKSLTLAAGFERNGHVFDSRSGLAALYPKTFFTNDAALAIKAADVTIEFTLPGPTIDHLRLVKKYQKKMVIGTTGFSSAQMAEIRKAAKASAILLSPNMSVGVNLLFSLSEKVASILNADYDVEIVEFHHRYKKDAPSGTAAKLAEMVAAGRGCVLDKNAVYGRKGITGERKRGAIGVHAVRGGDVIGDHTVSFLGDGERIELAHRASSRDAFATGALVAAKFLGKKKKGFFSMQDVLGLSTN